MTSGAGLEDILAVRGVVVTELDAILTNLGGALAVGLDGGLPTVVHLSRADDAFQDLRPYALHGSVPIARPSDIGASTDQEVTNVSRALNDNHLDALELLAEQAYDEGAVTEVIRPAAIMPEAATRGVLAELALHDVRAGGHWLSSPTSWRRYDRPWNGPDGAPGSARLVGSIQVAYGTPTRYEITIFRATVTTFGAELNWTVTLLCDEALSFGGLTLANCPRAELQPPPRPFRLH